MACQPSDVADEDRSERGHESSDNNDGRWELHTSSDIGNADDRFITGSAFKLMQPVQTQLRQYGINGIPRRSHFILLLNLIDVGRKIH
ncbi:hypothetical protein BBP40_009908 [Aspergillus hancockii]|nr:hypothetical protein BBP40_009908 [Aspergillus hancockii]